MEDKICSQRPFYRVPREAIKIPPSDAVPKIEGHEPGGDFPNCCPFHTAAFEGTNKWFEKFPDCCEPHREMAAKGRIKKSDYEGLPRKILDCLSFTEHHISKRIDTPDWYGDITDYIDYIWWSFGHPNIGFERYSDFLIRYLKITKSKIPKDKRERLIEYVENFGKGVEGASTSDLNIIYGTFQKWVKTFPFDLPYFKGLKERFEGKILVFKEPARFNPYTEMVKGRGWTQVELIDALEVVTKQLLGEVQTDKFEISDLNKHRLGLSNESLRIGTAKLVQGYSKGELRYVTTLKKWLELQKTYFKEVADIVGKPAPALPNWVVLRPAFEALFVDGEAAHRALRAAMSAGIIGEEGRMKLGPRIAVSAIIQFWEAVSDRKFELTHLRAEKESIGETYQQQCEAIAEQFGTTVGKSAIYQNAGKRAGKYFTAVARALGGT